MSSELIDAAGHTHAVALREATPGSYTAAVDGAPDGTYQIRVAAGRPGGQPFGTAGGGAVISHGSEYRADAGGSILTKTGVYPRCAATQRLLYWGYVTEAAFAAKQAPTTLHTTVPADTRYSSPPTRPEPRCCVYSHVSQAQAEHSDRPRRLARQQIRNSMSHILLISANERLALRLQIALLHRNIMSEVASTFRRGLAIAEARPPAAIVLDGAIPELDGARLASVTAALSSPTPIPVLVLAPNGQAEQGPPDARSQHAAQPPAPEAPLLELLRQQGFVRDA